MGEVADMMLDGTLCEQCGVFIGFNIGAPRTCAGCRPKKKRKRKKRKPRASATSASRGADDE